MWLFDITDAFHFYFVPLKMGEKTKSFTKIAFILCLYIDTDPHYIEIGVGESANITCTMDLDVFRGRRNSTSLMFVEEDTDKRIPKSEIYVSKRRFIE